MDIEELVKKYFDPNAVYMVEGREAMRSALTELADWHEQKLSSAKLEIERLQLIIEKCGESDLIACRKINEANERIRQLEAERVPEGWEIVFAPFDCHGTRICPFCGCMTNANAMACCNRAAKESILAAQQPKKEGE